jgi:hypothetical protein
MGIIKLLQYILISIIFTSLIYADTNGVWHSAEDVVGGTFGTDEGTLPFYFLNNVGVGTTTATSILTVNGSTKSSIFIDYENSSYFIDLNQNSRLKELNTQDISTNTLTSASITNTGSISTNTISSTKFSDSDNPVYYLDPSGPSLVLSLYAPGFVRAEQFRDYTDPSYFLDPNGASNLKDADFVSLTINSNPVATQNYAAAGDAATLSSAATAAEAYATAADTVLINDLSLALNTQYISTNTLTSASITNTGVISTSIISSTKFLDSDNPVYYLDPSGASLVLSLYAPGFVRAEQFRDYTDPSYFLDLNGASNLKDADFVSITINGNPVATQNYVTAGDAATLSSAATAAEAYADANDNINDADFNPANELQNIDQVLTRGNSAGNQRIRNLVNPISAQDAATKNYVDNKISSNCNNYEPLFYHDEMLRCPSEFTLGTNNIALGTSYTTVGVSGPYPDSGNELINGVMSGYEVGFSDLSPGNAITITLGSVSIVGEVSFYFTDQDGAAGVDHPTIVRIYGSVDGSEWVSLGEMLPSNYNTVSGSLKVAKLAVTPGILQLKYIKIEFGTSVFGSGGWVMANEVRIFPYVI